MKVKRTYKPRKLNGDSFLEMRNLAFSLRVSYEELTAVIAEVGFLYDDIQSRLRSYHNPYLRRTKGWHL